MDIYRQGDPVALGSGWYPPESYRGEEFRWVNNDARVNVAQLLPRPYVVSLEVEPGPGVGLKPFELKVLDADHEPITSVQVLGRQTVSFEIAAGPPKVHELTLHLDGGGRAAVRDERILNFRTFKLSVKPAQTDIVPIQYGLKVGSGWYPLETFNEETFRWAGNEAVIEALDPSKISEIELDVEPGPGVDLKPFNLKVLDQGGSAIAEFHVKERQKIIFPQREGNGPAQYRLRAEGGGKMAVGDARIMNFRAFSIS